MYASDIVQMVVNLLNINSILQQVRYIMTYIMTHIMTYLQDCVDGKLHNGRLWGAVGRAADGGDRAKIVRPHGDLRRGKIVPESLTLLGRRWGGDNDYVWVSQVVQKGFLDRRGPYLSHGRIQNDLPLCDHCLIFGHGQSLGTIVIDVSYRLRGDGNRGGGGGGEG